MRVGLLSLIALLTAGCWTPWGAALQRHSREYGCPESEIQLQDLGSYAYRATGCGHQVTYQCADTGPNSGTWCVPIGENTGGGVAGGGSTPGAQRSVGAASGQAGGRADEPVRLEEGTLQGQRALRIVIPRLGASLVYAPGADRDAVVAHPRETDAGRCREARLLAGHGEPRVARPGDDDLFRWARAEIVSMEQSDRIAIILCGASAELHGDEATTFRRFVAGVRELAAASSDAHVPSEPAASPEVQDTRSWLDGHREVILGCAARATVVVRVEPGGESARVSLQAPLAGTPEEECVRAALGAPPAAAVPASPVIHAVR